MAASREHVVDFLAQRTLALAGASRGGRKFGNTIHRALRAKGYRILLVHPAAAAIDGERCWPTLQSLPEAAGGVVIVTPPAETEKVVQQAVAAGIRRVWLQQGSESREAVRICEASGVTVIQRECILMFAEPVSSIHGVHRWLWRVLGKLPR